MYTRMRAFRKLTAPSGLDPRASAHHLRGVTVRLQVARSRLVGPPLHARLCTAHDPHDRVYDASVITVQLHQLVRIGSRGF